MPYNFSGVIREESPCKECPDKHLRPGCRKGCQKDADWHSELERVKRNQREYMRGIDIGFNNNSKNGGKK